MQTATWTKSKRGEPVSISLQAKGRTRPILDQWLLLLLLFLLRVLCLQYVCDEQTLEFSVFLGFLNNWILIFVATPLHLQPAESRMCIFILISALALKAFLVSLPSMSFCVFTVSLSTCPSSGIPHACNPCRSILLITSYNLF